MTENQVWINLSSQEFQSKKYPNDGHTTGYFKIATGLWFSLPVNSRYVAKWGEYSKDDSNLQNKLKNDKGETCITSARLKETVYTIHLNQWKEVLKDVLKNTSYKLGSEEKRKILLDRIRLETGNPNIEYLIFDIKENEFDNIREMYYEQTDEEIEKQQRARVFEIVEDTFRSFISPKFYENFDSHKNNTLLKIAFLKNLRRMKATGSIDYEELEKYFTDDDRNETKGNRIMAEFYGIYNVRETSLDDYIKHELIKYGRLSDEQIDMYEQLIRSANNLDDYYSKRRSMNYSNLTQNIEITWITDYFSGCINEKYIPGYDMPSLAIFDTDCINVISQRKEKIFLDKDNDLDDELLSSKEKRSPKNNDYDER